MKGVDYGVIYVCWRLQRCICGMLCPIQINVCGLLWGIGCTGCEIQFLVPYNIWNVGVGPLGRALISQGRGQWVTGDWMKGRD